MKQCRRERIGAGFAYHIMYERAGNTWNARIEETGKVPQKTGGDGRKDPQ